MTAYAMDVLRYRSALRDAVEMSTTTRGVLYILAQWMDPDGTNAWPGLSTLAASCQMRERTVSRHLELAIKAGYLNRQEAGHRGRTAVYRACIPMYRWDDKACKLVQPLPVVVPDEKAARGCNQSAQRRQPVVRKAANW